MGGSPCRMSIISNGNVAVSILRKAPVALSILRKAPVALSILRKSSCRLSLKPKKGRVAVSILGVYNPICSIINRHDHNTHERIVVHN